MGYDWVELDQLLRWRARKGIALQPKVVHEVVVAGGEWRVLGKRGTKRSGNQDLLAIVERPNGDETGIEALKDLISDVVEKSVEHRTWMKGTFLPALILVVALGENPDVALPAGPHLPGIPPDVLLNALQVIALTEHRKYGYREPFGGCYLLVRVCVGIVWGVWEPSEITWGRLMKDTIASLRAETGVREPTLGMVLAKSDLADNFELTRLQLEVLCL